MAKISGTERVLASGAYSGEILWRYTAGMDAARVRACCGWAKRGVALGDGKVLWSIEAEDELAGCTITSAHAQ